MIDLLRKERVRLRPELAAMLEKAAAAIESGLDHTAHVYDKGSDELQEEAPRTDPARTLVPGRAATARW